jgi:hypothetical protein
MTRALFREGLRARGEARNNKSEIRNKPESPNPKYEKPISVHDALGRLVIRACFGFALSPT